MPRKSPFREEDMRFKRQEKEPKPRILAVVFFVMDQSGSMVPERITIARAVCQYMVRWLRKKREYKDVKMVFIKQEAESEEVSEENFFKRAGSGGTLISSAWELINEMIKNDYPPSRYNVYAVHFTDGENFGTDNEYVEARMRELLSKVNLFGYFQYKDSHHTRSTTDILKYVQKNAKNLRLLLVPDLHMVRPALEEFLKED